ncbi:MAG: 30S ribosomal protein S9 [Gemmatimonadota bacterium]
MASEINQHHGVGRRKSSVARVYLRPGSGAWRINGRDAETYFPRESTRMYAAEPLEVTESAGQWDVLVNVRGGGLTGQAGAVRLGIARALVDSDEDLRPTLRQHGLLTRDAREVERKKPGRPKARKRFQFSKR